MLLNSTSSQKTNKIEAMAFLSSDSGEPDMCNTSQISKRKKQTKKYQKSLIWGQSCQNFNSSKNQAFLIFVIKLGHFIVNTIFFKHLSLTEKNGIGKKTKLGNITST